MISEQDEGAELAQELNEDEKMDSSNVKITSEHTKPKRRRRGKGRKQRKESGAAIGETHADEKAGETKSWNSDEDLDCESLPIPQSIIVRPINVPKAPENSTSFIIDDHNECHLYMSFETPHLNKSGQEYHDENDPVYHNIDYEYESPQDFDNSMYFDRDFEMSYNNNRFEELMRLSRNKLMSGVVDLESRLRNLNEQLETINPTNLLEKLQSELLELQEKNNELKEFNNKVTNVQKQIEKGSALPQDFSFIMTSDGVLNPSYVPSKYFSDSDESGGNRTTLDRQSATLTDNCSTSVNANELTTNHSPVHDEHLNL
ncbi:uncharacterized protein CDAR_65771 [Caerostris darwini]|uniref:Uncharacterized protein n=1 Tax=Caerostris darwini TaxID=1538125 RepID=A0AAV4UC60_9ARAC|nr:uncharacterized protein CDAR_65771 [Caerostris darwini]